MRIRFEERGIHTSKRRSKCMCVFIYLLTCEGEGLWRAPIESASAVKIKRGENEGGRGR